MIIDLRSDTVTKPSKEMLAFMMNANVGDDVYNEDETVIALEQKVAQLFGKEAGLFCPSGTMTNQIAINIHTQPGNEVICDVNSHIYNYESGGIAKNSSVQVRLAQGDRGRITAQQVQDLINPDLDWFAKSALVSIENTCNRAGGSYYTLQNIEEISTVCKQNNIPFHLDGARIFNAITETGYTTQQLGKLVDTVSVCLSKGLGAPIGSVLLGTKDHMKKARRVRKAFGGGMRQAGIIAAAGIYALDNNIARLKEDHKKAQVLKGILLKASYIKTILPVDTNIVIFTLNDDVDSDLFAQHLLKFGIKTAAFGKQTYRFVTHLDINNDMLTVVEKALLSF